MKIACLHTMESNIPIFEAVRPDGVELEHHVRQDLLDRALAAGEATEQILAEAAGALAALDGDGALLTCSTIGAAAPRAGAVRVDAALAREAAAKARGGAIAALVTAPSTVGPTRALFEAEADGASVEVVLIDGALEHFQSGDFDTYYDMIAAAADASTADVVALAQASMAPAAARARREALTSPGAGLAAAVAAVRASR